MARALIRLSTAAVLAERLRAEEASVGLAEEDLHPEHLRARVVARVRVREEVDLLVVLVAEPPERLLAGAGPGRRAVEEPDDRGALRAAVTGLAPGDDVGRDPPLPVRRPRERNEAPLAGHPVLHLDGVADGEDVRVARPHVLVDADPAALADLEPGGLRERRVGPHADREDDDVGRVRLPGGRLDLERAAARAAREAGDAVAEGQLDAVAASRAPRRGARSPGRAARGPGRASR